MKNTPFAEKEEKLKKLYKKKKHERIGKFEKTKILLKDANKEVHIDRSGKLSP